MRRRDEAVLEALRRGPLTCLQIVGRTGLARATVYSTLSRLLSAGLIERVDEWEERGQKLYRARDVVGRAGGTVTAQDARRDGAEGNPSSAGTAR